MEALNSFWYVGVAAFIGGGVIGAILYRFIVPAAKRTAELRTRLDQSEQAMNDYRSKVSDHFNKTSDLVNELTQDYVKIHRHLAAGAQMLGDPERASNMLERQGKTLIPFTEEESIDPASRENISEAIREAAEAVREVSGQAAAPPKDGSAAMAPESATETQPADETEATTEPGSTAPRAGESRDERVKNGESAGKS